MTNTETKVGWPSIQNVTQMRAADALLKQLVGERDGERAHSLRDHMWQQCLAMIAGASNIVSKRDIKQLARWVAELKVEVEHTK